MRRQLGHRASVSAILVVGMLAASGPALAQAGDGGVDVSVEFLTVTDSYALGNSVGSTAGLRGSTNSDGWLVINRGRTCYYSSDLLTAPDTLSSDHNNLQRHLAELGVIELVASEDPGPFVYQPTSAYAHRFDHFAHTIGGWSDLGPNCVQTGLGYLDTDCSLVPGGTPATMAAPVRAIGGVWVLSHGTFVQGVHGGAAGYSYVCVETYYEPAFTAAILAQTDLVIPQVTLEARVRAAVGTEIGAWYTVSDDDQGRDPFRDAFSISVPTRGDPVPTDVTLWLEQIRWDVDGDGEWDIIDDCAPHEATEPPAVFDCGGSEDEPIGEFVFDFRGLYNPTVELQWDGYFIAHFHSFTRRGPFDTAELITAHTLIDFPVIEIRSSLDS